MNSLSQQDRNLNCWQTGEVSARTSRTLQSCALHTNSVLCYCWWLLISKAFSSQCSGNLDHNKTRLHYLFRAATMSSCNLTATLTRSFLLRFKPYLTYCTSNWTQQVHLQESDIYLWLCNIEESVSQLQVMLSKYLEEAWPVPCS